jgi:hypothetical protein
MKMHNEGLQLSRRLAQPLTCVSVSWKQGSADSQTSIYSEFFVRSHSSGTVGRSSRQVRPAHSVSVCFTVALSRKHTVDEFKKVKFRFRSCQARS